MKKLRVATKFTLFLCLFITLSYVSYYLYIAGYTDNMRMYLKKAYASVITEEVMVEEYPIIQEVINSSGRRLVNEEIAITVKASDKINVKKFYYSYDKVNWYTDFDNVVLGKDATAIKVFNKNIDSKLYIYVKNDNNYKSYVYSTSLSIDKEAPKIIVSTSFNNSKKKIVVTARDNNVVKKLQYSYDGKKWFTNYKYTYYSNIDKLRGELIVEDQQKVHVRAVDSAGNISVKKTIK